MTPNHTTEASRTCKSCACSYLIEPPRVPTAQQLKDNPAIANAKAVRICRLNPPTVLFVDAGPGRPPIQKLAQAPTDDYFTCWHWKGPGTLPGDDMPPFRDDEPETAVKGVGLVVC